MANKAHSELIVREGWPFLFPLLALTLISFGLQLHWAITLVLGLLTLFVLNFFRNPYRQIPQDPNSIVSPGDGVVVSVRETDENRQCISIFLNVFNVHVNRSPISGTIKQIDYRKGKFLAASKPEASVENEMNSLTIQDQDFEIEVIQIAGLIARRIICWNQPQDTLQKGERFGLIRFGSRVDLFMPKSCQVVVKVGQKVKGGRDILAHRPQTS